MMKFNKLLFAAVVIVFAYACDDSSNEPAPTLNVSNFSASIDENPVEGQVIGVMNVQNGVDLDFELSNEQPEGALEIDDEGEITVKDASLFDFETNPTIRATANVEGDDGQQASASITITLNNVVEDGEDDGSNEQFNIWSGAKVSFSKADGADPNAAENQDRITDNVWITRSNGGGQIFNIAQESNSSKSNSPVDTEWAVGTTGEINSLTFAPLRTTITPKNVVGRDLVLHLISDDIYIDIRFTSWSQGKQGGFAYERSSE